MGTSHLELQGVVSKKTKQCTQCGSIKPITEFYKNSCTSDGYRAYCKECSKKINKRWRTKDAENARKRWREASKKHYSKPNVDFRKKLSKYGLKEKDFRALEDKHQGLCGICGEEKTLVIDHCHETKKVRGLLCDFCNKGLGLFKDNRKNLEQAIKYLNN